MTESFNAKTLGKIVSQALGLKPGDASVTASTEIVCWFFASRMNRDPHDRPALRDHLFEMPAHRYGVVRSGSSLTSLL